MSFTLKRRNFFLFGFSHDLRKFFSANKYFNTFSKSNRCIRNNCLSVFCKIVAELFLQNFKLKTASQRFFSEFCKNFKNTFLQDTSGLLLLIFRKHEIQTFNSQQICSLDIAGRQYLLTRYCRRAIFVHSILSARIIQCDSM